MQSYLEISKLLITPYVPNVVDTANPLETVQRPSNPKAKRDILVYFRGRCTPYKDDNVGKKLRYATVSLIRPYCLTCCSPTQLTRQRRHASLVLACSWAV